MRLPVPDPRGLLQLPERWLSRVGDLLDGAERVVQRVDDLLDRIEATRQRADAAARRADLLVADVEPLVGRAGALLDDLEPPLTALLPSLEALARTTSPEAVAVLGRAVDRVPEVLRRFDDDLLPVLSTLESVAPDLSELLQASHELNEMLGGLPGMKRIRRRVEEEMGEEHDDGSDRARGGTMGTWPPT